MTDNTTPANQNTLVEYSSVLKGHGFVLVRTGLDGDWCFRISTKDRFEMRRRRLAAYAQLPSIKV